MTQRTQHAQIDETVRWPGREIGLTERESELLSLLSTGMTNRELGGHLYISENTVKTQLRHLYAKLGVRNPPRRFPSPGPGSSVSIAANPKWSASRSGQLGAYADSDHVVWV